MIAIIDYGMGNISSVSNALIDLGCDVCVTDNQTELERASHIILPGVGSFQAAAQELNNRQLREILHELAKSKPILGICLGMQLLFTKGYEGEQSLGLNLIPGTVEKMRTVDPLPHIGWNTLDVKDEEFGRFQDQYVYFVHSYIAKTDSKYVMATTDYGTQIPAIVRKGNIYGMQFHPEKSGAVGRKLIEIFLQSNNIKIVNN